jgi:hypothetical protein
VIPRGLSACPVSQRAVREVPAAWSCCRQLIDMTGERERVREGERGREGEREREGEGKFGGAGGERREEGMGEREGNREGKEEDRDVSVQERESTPHARTRARATQ